MCVLRSATPHAMSAVPEISVVIPCLNEEEAVGTVVDQALEGIRRSGRTGEVLVVDNGSTDHSAEIAAEHGARVVTERRRGYGSAYLTGLAEARGRYIVMGDADETYPLVELGPFVDRFARADRWHPRRVGTAAADPDRTFVLVVEAMVLGFEDPDIDEAGLGRSDEGGESANV